jgi:hypothetical protein
MKIGKQVRGVILFGALLSVLVPGAIGQGAASLL